jgi:excisionase family DNA binding protein
MSSIERAWSVLTSGERKLVALGRQVWLTAEEAALYLRLPTVKALYQAVRRGHLPARYLGNRLRFLRDELDAALARNRP